jgi:hypothetical protein
MDQLVALTRKYQEARQQLESAHGALVRPLLDELDRQNAEEAVASLHRQLLQTFDAWSGQVRSVEDFVAVRFFYAGGEVAPYVPCTAWSYGYAGAPFDGIKGRPRAVLFKELAGFEPHPLVSLYDAGEEGRIPEEVSMAELIEPWLSCSLDWTGRALSRAVQNEAFTRLRPCRPFHFIVTPGHDQPERLLFVAE